MLLYLRGGNSRTAPDLLRENRTSWLAEPLFATNPAVNTWNAMANTGTLGDIHSMYVLGPDQACVMCHLG